MPREVGDWTRDKLRLLELYLPGYLQATTRAIDRVYIDAFAGPGLNRLRQSGEVIDGSPLIALNARAMDTGARFTKLYFIENDPVILDELAEELEIRGSDPRVELVEGDVNEVLPRVVGGLNRAAPTFVFLDTEGIDPRWSTLEAIAPWRTELLVNFPLGMSINRNPQSQKVRQYFGTDEWRPLWEHGDERGLLDLYKRRLADLGYTEQVAHDRLIRTEGGSGQRLYYLIPVSKVAAARNIWSWVFNQPDAGGQGRLRL